MANDPQTYALGYEGPEVQHILEKSDDIGPATQGKDGLMSASDKVKLDGVSTGAQANVIEQIEVGGVILEPSSKKVIIPVDAAAAQGGANPVSSGALYAALLNYYTSAEVDQLIAGIKQFTYEVVAELPTASADTMYCIYFVPSTNPETQNVKDEYITVRSREEGSYTYSWEQIGTTAVDISGKADKVSGATAGNLAGLDASGNLVDSGVAAEKIGDIEEEVSVLRNSAGIAEGIADTISAGTPQEFVFRQSGGDGVNYMKRIKGRSIVWNQIVNMSLAYTEVGGLTFTLNSDKTITINGTTTQAFGVDIFIANNVIDAIPAIPAGRKVLWRNKTISGSVTVPTGSVKFGTGYGGYVLNLNESKIINESNGKGKQGIVLYCDEGVTFSNLRIAFNLVDLTLMFDAGNEPSSVAEFEALYPEAYYPYNAGSVESNDASEIETVGRNLWDEEWEGGSISTVNGENADIASYIRSKNYIPCFPSSNYYYKMLAVNGDNYIYYYDVNKNFISSRSTAKNITGVVFTTPANCYYIRFVYYSTTYNHDICINLSDASFNGQYEPYWKRTLNLGLKAIKVTDGTNIITVDGLKSAGSVYDEIDLVRKKYIKRVGSVDLGDLEWAYESNRAYFHVLISDLNGNVARPGMICAKYFQSMGLSIYNGTAPDKSISNSLNITGGGNDCYIKDSAYTDAATFKAAMSGVMLNYELATPIEYDLVDDIPNSILVDNLGTEQAIFPVHNDETPSAPFACDSNYSISVKNLVAFINAQNNG